MSPERDPYEGEAEAELSEIEAALGSLAPARGRVDRDRVMFEAGRSSIRPRANGLRAWKALAAGCGLVALGEGALLARRPPERVVERVVVVREPSPALEVDPPRDPETGPRPLDPGPGPGAHDRLAWQVLRYGLDGLPTPSPAIGNDRPPSIRSLRQEIGKVLELGDPS